MPPPLLPPAHDAADSVDSGEPTHAHLAIEFAAGERPPLTHSSADAHPLAAAAAQFSIPKPLAAGLTGLKRPEENYDWVLRSGLGGR